MPQPRLPLADCVPHAASPARRPLTFFPENATKTPCVCPFNSQPVQLSSAHQLKSEPRFLKSADVNVVQIPSEPSRILTSFVCMIVGRGQAPTERPPPPSLLSTLLCSGQKTRYLTCLKPLMSLMPTRQGQSASRRMWCTMSIRAASGVAKSAKPIFSARYESAWLMRSQPSPVFLRGCGFVSLSREWGRKSKTGLGPTASKL